MCVKLGYAKFQPLSAREAFLNWGLNGGGRKKVHFLRKTGHISETVRNMAEVTVNHQ